MAYSYVVYTGNGTTTQFTVPFPYIRREHVFVSLDYVSTTFTWINNTTVEVSPAPTNGERVEVRRVTPVNNPLVDFTDGSTLVAADLDTNALQQTYINQEQDDQFQDAIFINAQGNLDAGGKRITNVGDPVDAQDAVTKTWVETAGASPLVQFRSIYYGSATSDPVTDPYGNPPTDGDLHFNTSLEQMRVYNGAFWQDASAEATITRYKFTAVGGETSLSGADDDAIPLNYNVGLELVYLNGALLTRGVDYTATNGTSITGLAALSPGDFAEVVALSQINIVDSIPGANIVDGTITTAKLNDSSVTSAKIVDGTIVNADINASAAIAGTKVSPDFGSQNVVTTGTATAASLNPTGSSVPANGVYLPGANRLGIATNTTARLEVDASGRLLVGTSTARDPAGESKIEAFNGPISVSTFANSAGFYGLNFIKSRGTSTNVIVQNNDSLAGVRFFGADGTGFPEAARIEAFVDGTPGANDMPGRLVFSSTPSGSATPVERMRIAANGRIAFGGQGAPYSGATCDTYNNTSDNFAHAFRQDHASGYGIGIGVDGTSLAFFYPNKDLSGPPVGSISQNGSATAYNTSSDYRLKENVVPLTGAIDRLQQIPVHRFNFIANPDRTVDGFLAHEAQEVVPECVTGTKDEVDDDGNPVYQGIDQSKLVPLLTAALQEALQKIEDLEGRLTAAGL